MDSVSPFLSGDKAQPKGICGSMAGSKGRCAILSIFQDWRLNIYVMIWISSATFPKQNLGNSYALHHPLST